MPLFSESVKILQFISALLDLRGYSTPINGGTMRKGQMLFMLALITAAMVLSACSQTPAETTTPATPAAEGGKAMQWSNPPPMTIDQNKQYTATIKTNYGDIVLQLFPKDAPLAVNNFVFLARQGFYNGVKFHRVVKGFVIQGGDPTGTGTGGPGYRFADEKVTKDYVAGTLAMANAGSDTNGSQFFISLADLSGSLPKKYTIFGQVTGGFDVVQKIGDVPVEGSSPVKGVLIDSITIEEK
jgi:cyclophilin family peptidyl-prolyl cis-trans isomerase